MKSLLSHSLRAARSLQRNTCPSAATPAGRLALPVRSLSSSTAHSHSHCEEDEEEGERPAVGRLPATGPSAEDKKNYKSDPQTLARWLDVSVVKRKGRCFDADRRLVSPAQAMVFPPLTVSSLAGESVQLPHAVPAKAKLVVFSFKHYGFSLVRSWLEPWLNKYPDSTQGAVAVEVCFVEFGFLSMAKSLFATSIKNQISESQHATTFLAFGGITDFAANLLLPNVYTGYAFLLDKDNRIRWQGCGEALDSEILTLLQCADALLIEDNKTTTKKK